MSSGRFEEVSQDLFMWKDDTCNVYVVRHGNRGLLVDVGSARVLEALPEIGVERVEQVMLTQHHREHCQGIRSLDPGIRVVAPAAEGALLSHPDRYRTRELGADPYTVGGAYYVRLPRESARVDLTVADGELHQWGGLTFEIYDTPGASPGAVTYVMADGTSRIAFNGNVCLDDGRLYRLFDSEWDYGYASGLRQLLSSQHLLERLELTMLCPAHGPVVTDPNTALKCACARLRRFIDLMLRDYDEEDAAMAFEVSRPTGSPGLRAISPHLFSMRTARGHNAYVLLSETGQALFVDCGIFLPEEQAISFLDEKLRYLEEAEGLRGVDAVVITHYHGDHLMQIPYLRATRGAEVWALDNCLHILEEPQRFNRTWMLPAYGVAPGSIAVDRVLRPEETVEWNEYQLLAFHCPGQTDHALGLFGEIDGRRVAFTGDNIFYSRTGSGHDAYSMFNNGSVVERGYMTTARRLLELDPDLILGGHAQEIPQPRRQVERLLDWAHTFCEELRELTILRPYEEGVDPFWARFDPFRAASEPGGRVWVTLHVQNYGRGTRRVRARFKAPKGWRVTPELMEAVMLPRSHSSYPVELRIPSGAQGLGVLTADLHLEGEHVGEFPEAIIWVE